ncbi:MAG TPA: ATP-binding cassette domain-containing protein [Jatrophihabitantaceae bacterium]
MTALVTTADLVTCAGVARTFGTGPTAVVAVHDVTCSVSRTTRSALTGSSGSGKSTLLHLLAGLDTPTAGTVNWPGLGGHPLARPGRIGVVFQGPSLLPALTVAENVALPMLLDDSTERDAHARALEALAVLGIGDLHPRLPEELSGGQAQRVAVARVLAARPALILADEPTGQLDHDTATTVIDALLTACSELDAALVVSTHDPLIAARLPEQWVMRDGSMIESREAGR